MWCLLATLCLSFSVAASYEQLPCKTSIYDDNLTKCIVEVREDLPSFHDEAQYEIVYLSHPVHGTGTELSRVMGFVHSSIGVKKLNATSETLYNFEFWALHFNPKGIVIPAIENGTLKWSSEGVVTWASWTPEHAKKVWPHQVSLGYTNGSMLGQFMDWVHGWHQGHRYYQLFSVWSKPELGSNLHRYFDDTTCNTFTEDGLTALHRLGAPLTSKELLCRTYVVLDAAGPLQSVKTFSVEHLQMMAYYDALGTVLAKFKNLTVRKALELVGVARMEKAKPFAFVYDRDNSKYYKAMLQSPYFEVWPMYLSQRMVLPWQSQEDSRSRECDPWAVPHESNMMV